MPSQKVIATLIIVFAFVVGIIGFDLIKDNQAKNIPEETVVTEETTQQNTTPAIQVAREGNLTSTDTDGDGLLDWEEELRGSDPENEDTDGDGTKDGEEVENGRDPTVPGPNDTFNELLSSENVNNYDIQIPLVIEYTEGTLSDSVAQNFISNYWNINPNDTASIDNLTQTIAEDASEMAQINDKYSISDLTTFPDYDKEKIREYGNNFSTIIVVYYAAFASVDNPDEETYINLIALLFETFAEDLSKISVPVGLIDTHLEFLNNINVVSESLKSLTESEKDPVNAFFALTQYEDVANNQVVLFTEMANYFRANDIIFTDEESGVMWNNF